MRIVAKDLTFSYDKKAKNVAHALCGVTLTIESGEFFGIIGQTGSGKSTFVQHLNGLVPLQSGYLSVGEFDLTLKGKKAKKNLMQLRKKVGMVFQYPEYQLFAETVFDDVAFGVKNFYPELTKDQVCEKVRLAIEKVGLDFNEIKDKSPFDLSGGQKRRVAIAGVIVSEPEVLVLDEPVAGLDPHGKSELWSLLHSLNEGGRRTIIVVSHDMDDVLQHCETLAVFANGRTVAVGPPRQVFAKSEIIESAGLDLPLTSYLAGRLQSVGFDVEKGLKIDEFIESILSR